MNRLLVFNFDGTGNEPEDAEQKQNKHGKTEDDNITNVLKLHLMLGGNLFQEGSDYGTSTLPDVDYCFYYQGVGTYGGWFSRLLNQGVAPSKRDVDTITNKALADFKSCGFTSESDVILITGFSRGAALARRFAAKLTKMKLVENKCIFLCVYDTVASFGAPNLSTEDRPEFDVVFEHGNSIAKSIVQAVHMVSLDDKRKAFQPTLMNAEDHILEVWFAGAHSDVGGGYYRDGLSDISLSFTLKWLLHMSQNGDISLPKLLLKLPTQKEIDDACPDALKGKITLDDIQRNPDPMAKNHQQDRWPIIDWFTLDDRRFCVMRDGEIDENAKPLLHWTVPVRINRDRDYRPKSLNGVNHQVWYDFINPAVECTGFAEHEQSDQHNWQQCTAPIQLKIEADLLRNFSGIKVKAGDHYKISADPEDEWLDASIKCNASGWDPDDPELELSWKKFPIKLMSHQKRIPDANYFALCVAVIDDISKQEVGIQSLGLNDENVEFEAVYEVVKDGELVFFANDIKSRYGNNAGAIEITITKES